MRAVLQESLGAFIDGLTTFRAKSLAAAVTVCATLLALLAIFVTPKTIVSASNSVSIHDEFFQLTCRVLASEEETLPAVSLMSASSLRDAISDSTILREAAAKHSGTEHVFHDFTSGNLTFWEILAISEKIADSHSGIMLISMAPKKFARGEKQISKMFDRLGFKSAALNERLKKDGHDCLPITGNYFVDNFRFLTPRRKSLLFSVIEKPSSSERPHPGDKLNRIYRDELDLRLVRLHSRGLKTLLTQFYDECDNNFEMLAESIRLLEASGKTKVVLIEAPFNPLVYLTVYGDPVYGVVLDDYQQRMQAFAKEMNVEYWQLDREADLQDFEFADNSHLGRFDARERYTRVIAKQIEALMAP